MATDQIQYLLEQGFQQIQDEFTLMMDCLSEILEEFGKSHLRTILPIVGNPQALHSLPIKEQQEAVALLSLSLQLLNVVEQHATDVFRKATSEQVGPEYVSGSVAEVLADLRKQGLDWTDIVDIWQRLSLQLVFTAHPTEARRPSLIAQLRQFFTDLQNTQHAPSHKRNLILKNLECLLGTGEFIHDKPSVDTERDFITRTIRSSLPQGLLLFAQEVKSAFITLGCPAELIPTLSNYPRVRFRSWVASDRDGHPYVTAEETQRSLERNREEALQLVKDSLAELANLLTLSRYRMKVPSAIADRFLDEEPWRAFCKHLEKRLETLPIETLITELELIVNTLHEAGAHLLAYEAERVLFTVNTFGFHLVAQDIRQNSASYHQALVWILNQSGLDSDAYEALNDEERCSFISQMLLSPKPLLASHIPLEGPALDAITSLKVVAKAIQTYGPACIGSIIVSMTRQSSDLLQVLIFAREAGLLSYSQGPTPLCPIPIVPLIETAQDHAQVLSILSGFIQNPVIAASIRYYHQGQAGPPGVRMMCGHSDGGKDAGIVDNFRMMLDTRAKVANFLVNLGYAPIFFEGIGGTLIRGAAPIKYLIAHSLPAYKVAGFEYTEQGQIIAQNHLVPFMSAWSIQNALAALLHHEAVPNVPPLPAWFSSATAIASKHYQTLVNASAFTPFFNHATPLDLLEFARMGSRPTRRTGANTLADLRAIPFALAQSQTRFNLTAWYGVGTMLESLLREAPEQFQTLCKNTHINFILTNVEMALKSASPTWMQAYAELEPDTTLRQTIMDQILREYALTTRLLDQAFGATFSQRRPRLARTIAKRQEVLDVLHRFQIYTLKKWRKAGQTHSAEEESWLLMGLMTMNAISNGLRGTG